MRVCVSAIETRFKFKALTSMCFFFFSHVTRTRPFRKTWMCPKIIPRRLNNVRMGVMMSEEGDVFSSSSSKSNNGSMGIELQPDLVSFGTLAAEMIPTTMVSSEVEDEEFDLDRPTDGFASIPQAIEDIRQGKVCISSTKVLRGTGSLSDCFVFCSW